MFLILFYWKFDLGNGIGNITRVISKLCRRYAAHYDDDVFNCLSDAVQSVCDKNRVEYVPTSVVI